MVSTIADHSGGGVATVRGRPLLCLVGCAAPPVLQIATAVEAAQAVGWRTTLVLTPTAAQWVASELPALGRRTGFPVRSQYSRPGETLPVPRADAFLVVPATANSLNKCAAGISDTLALGLMNEAIGSGTPIAAVACLGHDLGHPAMPATLAILRGAGVEVLAEKRAPRSPFPWKEGLSAISRIWSHRSPPDAGATPIASAG